MAKNLGNNIDVWVQRAVKKQINLALIGKFIFTK